MNATSSMLKHHVGNLDGPHVEVGRAQRSSQAEVRAVESYELEPRCPDVVQ